jgi:DNA polymerase-1
MKYALVLIHQALRGYDARLINTVHDEVEVEVREDQAEEVTGIVSREMRRAGESIVTRVPVLVDAKLADHWSK